MAETRRMHRVMRTWAVILQGLKLPESEPIPDAEEAEDKTERGTERCYCCPRNTLPKEFATKSSSTEESPSSASKPPSSSAALAASVNTQQGWSGST